MKRHRCSYFGSLHYARCARLHVESRLNNYTCSVGEHPSDAKDEYFVQNVEKILKGIDR